MRILVVQGDPRAGAALEQGFKEQSYLVDVVTGGCEALEFAQARELDVIILGRQLPDMDGVEVCRTLRRQGDGTPVIMMGTVDATEPVVNALDAGADDYVTKPIEFEELLARVRAMLRRCTPDEGSMLRYEGIEVDLANRNVTVDGEVVVLTPREFALLEYMIRHRERVVTRSALCDRVWGLDDRLESSNVVDVYVSRLRRKLSAKRDIIQTVHGTGYMLAAAAPTV